MMRALAGIAVVVLLIALPLWWRGETAPFSGADAAATELAASLRPGYKPWMESPFRPPSAEIESLLFSLQAALGAGVLGYVLGVARGRSRASRHAPDR